jgi:hypothetical protein
MFCILVDIIYSAESNKTLSVCIEHFCILPSFLRLFVSGYIVVVSMCSICAERIKFISGCIYVSGTAIVRFVAFAQSPPRIQRLRRAAPLDYCRELKSTWKET